MKHLTRAESDLTPREYTMLAKLSTPIKIQDFLDGLPMNWEKKGETHMVAALRTTQKKSTLH